MSTFNKFSDLNGLLTIRYIGGDSPLRVGEPVATHTPFEALKGFESGMGMKVSDKKMDAVLRKQNKHQSFEFGTIFVRTVNENFFYQEAKADIAEKIFNKKKIKNEDGKWVSPKLSQEEHILCVLIDTAMHQFYSLSGVQIKCSFYNGQEITWVKS